MALWLACFLLVVCHCLLYSVCVTFGCSGRRLPIAVARNGPPPHRHAASPSLCTPSHHNTAQHIRSFSNPRHCPRHPLSRPLGKPPLDDPISFPIASPPAHDRISFQVPTGDGLCEVCEEWGSVLCLHSLELTTRMQVRQGHVQRHHQHTHLQHSTQTQGEGKGGGLGRAAQQGQSSESTGL